MNATQAINMVARQTTGDNESWGLRVYFTVDSETSANLKSALEVDLDRYVQTSDEWSQREDARDLINEFHLIAGVRSEGSGIPGTAFAHFPSIRCVGNRVILTQSGGLDI